MAEQEKNRETTSYKEQLAKAMESLKGTPLPTDTDPTGPFWGMRPAPDRFKGLSLPKAERETTYLIEADDGTLVRVPESRLEAWKAADHNAPLNKAEQRLKDRILQEIYGSRK